MSYEDNKFLSEWFEFVFKRKPEHDKGYFEEWTDRYKQGFVSWIGYMDSNVKSMTFLFIGSYLF